METFRLTGLGVAAVTPFTPDKEIDFEALGRVLDHIMEGHAVLLPIDSCSQRIVSLGKV